MKKLMTDQQKVTPEQVWAEALLAGTDPKILAAKINSQIDRIEKIESNTKLTTETIRSLMSEAMKAGIDPHSEEMAKYLENTKSSLVSEREMTLDEEADMRIKVLSRQGIHAEKDLVKKVILKERELKRAEEDQLKKVQKKQRLVSEAVNAGASEEDIKKIIGE